MRMRVMAIEAHPDDVEYYCAGTLAKYAATGHELAIAIATNGEVGSPCLSKAETAALRETEARRAAALIGAEVFWLGYPDAFLSNSAQFRLHTIDTIRRFRPDVILTLDKDSDYHPDHVAAAQAVWDVRFLVTAPNIETESPPCETMPELFFMDTCAGIGFEPEIYVDITAHWETKAAMIACHQGQEAWCQDQYGFSLVENARVQSRFRGYQAGCQYAEAFRRPRFLPLKTAAAGLLPTNDG
jgi:LmbE family N-acetylglucosaminyl deacetylase